MPKPIFAFCADLQARESAYKSVKELFGDDLYALSQVVSFCRDNGVSLILGGDQVDTPVISDRHVIELRRLLMQNIAAGNENMYVDGNHERGFKRLSLEGGAASCASNLEDATSDFQVLNIRGHTVSGYNWRTRKQWEGVLEGGGLMPSDVLVLHGLAQQAVPQLNLPGLDPSLCDLDLSWFDGQYKLVLMGDIHMEWDWTGPKGTRFMYSGSMWMHRLGEPEQKSFIVVYDDLSARRHPLKCRPFYQGPLFTEQHAEHALNWLTENSDLEGGEAMREFMGSVLPRMHLTVPLELSPLLRKALQKLEASAHVFKKVQASREEGFSEQETSTAGRVDLATALGQVLDMSDPESRKASIFISQAVNSGIECAIKDLKQEVGMQ